MNPYIKLRLLWLAVILWFCGVLILTGCASPTAPPQTTITTALTIQTRWYASHPERPLAGVTVRIDGVVVGLTDEAGQLDVMAKTGSEILVSVERPPYVPMVSAATGTLLPDSHERWTFYFDLSN